MRIRLWVFSGLLLTLLLPACRGAVNPDEPTTGSRAASPTPGADVEAPAATTPTVPPPTPTPEPFPGDGPWEVTFAAADDVMLHGTLYGKSGAGIVLAPAHPGEQAGWASFAQLASVQGYRVLTFDFRGYGVSEGERSLTDAPADLEAAVAFLRELEAQPIILMGAGEGGLAAIKAAGGDSGLAGLVVISSPRAIDGLEVTDADLTALSLPSLWLGARTDMEQAIEEMGQVAGGEDKEIWVYEGSSLHGTYIFEGADGADLQRRLLEFTARVTGS